MQAPPKREKPAVGAAGSPEKVSAADEQNLTHLALRLQADAEQFLADRRRFRRLESSAVADARERIFGQWRAA